MMMVGVEGGKATAHADSLRHELNRAEWIAEHSHHEMANARVGFERYRSEVNLAEATVETKVARLEQGADKAHMNVLHYAEVRQYELRRAVFGSAR